MRTLPGGVAWRGSLHDLYDANLRLRAASRVLVRVARFEARAFSQLERRARAIDWSAFLAPGAAVRLNVTCRRSKLYHQRAVAERVLDAIERAGGAVRGKAVDGVTHADAPRRGGRARTASPKRAAAAARDEDGGDVDDASQLFIVRFDRDRCTISADASGALLHRRGYRVDVAKAPLRETLAAAMLLVVDWPASAPLFDPMCGSGTIPIEAALLARRIPPGLAASPRRRYAFEAWPGHEPGLLDAIIEKAAGEALPAAPAPITGADRDAGAVAAASANADRAGVGGDVVFERNALSAAEPRGEAGWLVTNPPYGGRVGEREPLRDLYAALGNRVRRRLPRWSVALLSADRRLEAQTSLAFDEVMRTRNGGIPVRLVVARPPHEA